MNRRGDHHHEVSDGAEEEATRGEINGDADQTEMATEVVSEIPMGENSPEVETFDTQPRSQYGSFLGTRSKLRHPDCAISMDTGITDPLMLERPDAASDEDSEADEDDHCFLRAQRSAGDFCGNHAKLLKYVSLAIVFVAYCVYLGLAIRYNAEHARALIVITALVSAAIVYVFVRDHFGEVIFRATCLPAGKKLSQHWHVIQWFVYPVLVLAVVLYLCLDVIRSVRQLQPFLGMAVFIFLPIISSKYPAQINWRPVLWGFALQFLIGVVVMRWIHGYNAVRWLSQQINTFLFYSLDGAAAVFGDPFFLFHPFLSVVVSLIVWIGAVLGVMYHSGLTQLVAAKVGWFMQLTLKTTAIESISLAVNIFLSVLETTLMLKPYFYLLTPSEFHCYLVGAHSTIAGFAFGLFVLFGVSPQHLLTGAVMSAPAAVAVSKLSWPETQISKFTSMENFSLDKGTDRNWIEAASNGAWAAAKSVMAITLQVIAFMSLYFFADTAIAWLGTRVGIELSIGIILGWVFMPVAFLLGVDWEDLSEVGRLLGLKVVANEFLGYILLGNMNRRRLISKRSAAIATYAMCGFSSFGTLAMFVGVWVTVDKRRTSEVVKQIPRIMLNANISCFLTACIAGIFYSEDIELQDSTEELSPLLNIALWILDVLPSFRDLLEPIGVIPSSLSS